MPAASSNWAPRGRSTKRRKTWPVARFVGEINTLFGRVVAVDPPYYDICVHERIVRLKSKFIFASGDRVNILIRPEDLRIWREHEGSDEERATLFPAAVEDVVRAGSTVDLIIRLDNGDRLSTTQFFNEDDQAIVNLDFQPGERVFVDWVHDREVILPHEDYRTVQMGGRGHDLDLAGAVRPVAQRHGAGRQCLWERGQDQFFAFAFTLASYRRLLDPLYLSVLLDSLYLAALTTVLCLLIGYPFAYLLAQAPARRRALLLLLVIIPFWTSSLVRTYAMVILLKTNGLINQMLLGLGWISEPLELLYTTPAVIAGMCYALLPFMILPLYAALEKLDRRDRSGP